MEKFDFIFDAKEANRRTTDLLNNNNKEILRTIFNDITHSISMGEYSTFYDFGGVKNEYISNILTKLGYKVEWSSDIDCGQLVYMLTISWEN